MNRLPQISEAEFEVMKIVWQYAPVSTNEITDRLMKTTSWGAKTIQTLIKRLTNKGALTYEKEGRVYVYTPLVKENEYISQQSNSFLRRFYDGDITAMLSAYIKNDRLSAEEIGTPVSYTHLDVYKRQPIPAATPIRATPMVPAEPQEVPVHRETTAVTRKEVTAI